jgi:hypothetical protein
MNSAPVGSPEADPNQVAQQAFEQMSQGSALGGVPGQKGDTTQNVEHAAEKEGQQVEHQVSQ